MFVGPTQSLIDVARKEANLTVPPLLEPAGLKIVLLVISPVF